MEVQTERIMVHEDANNLCLCSGTSNSVLEACQSAIFIIFSVVAVITNVITVLVFGKVRRRTSTENLLLAITLSELGLPIIVLARYVYISYDNSIEDFPYFRVLLFYAWNVLYVTTSLLTVLLAVRRFMAIEYPVGYQAFTNAKHTERIVFAIYICSALLYLPVLFYKPDFVHTRDENARKLCSDDLSKEVIYTSVMMASVYLKGSYTVEINFLLYISIYFFQLVSPLILAILSFKFMRSLNRRTTTSNRTKKKTQLIMIVSLLILLRDLPLGLLATYFVVFLPAPACLTTVRLVTQELMIVMCSMNFLVLYYTNQKFKESVPRLTSIFSCSSTTEGQSGRRNNENVFSSVYRSTTTPMNSAAEEA